jgi:hypothetical protein
LVEDRYVSFEDLNPKVDLAQERRRFRKHNRRVVSFNAVIVALAILALSLAVLSLPNRIRTEPFDPLELPEQKVLNRIDGVTGPALHLDEDLKVYAQKCNNSGQDVGVAGRIIWRSVDPAGTQVDAGGGSSIRTGTPRCFERNYSNPIPDGVVARTRELFDQGYPRVVWQLNGVETPLGPEAVPKAWSTEPFAILP